jgi:hypothetical protein
MKSIINDFREALMDTVSILYSTFYKKVKKTSHTALSDVEVEFETVEEIMIPKQNSTDSFRKGELFENYVRAKIFPKSLYTLVHRTHTHETNCEDFVESSLLPDFLFRCNASKKEFYVECKFRTNKMGEKYEWCKYYQLERYRALNEEKPTLLILGTGGQAGFPEKISLIPLVELRYTGLYPSFLDKYSIDKEIAVQPAFLQNLITG